MYIAHTWILSESIYIPGNVARSPTSQFGSGGHLEQMEPNQSSLKFEGIFNICLFRRLNRSSLFPYQNWVVWVNKCRQTTPYIDIHWGSRVWSLEESWKTWIPLATTPHGKKILGWPNCWCEDGGCEGFPPCSGLAACAGPKRNRTGLQQKQYTLFVN